MPKEIANNALILIGIMPSMKDLEIARVLGWYRIPIKSAPKIIEVDYFAFYQGANFGDDRRWRIEHMAEYRGHELTTRRELLREEKDHPRANEEYYKVQIGPLLKVEPAILADKWKRITFLYSTGEIFNRSRIVNDLVVRSEDREVLWKNLRERSQSGSIYKIDDQSEFPIDLAAIGWMFGAGMDLPPEDQTDY